MTKEDNKNFIPSRDLFKNVADRANVSGYMVDKIIDALSQEIVEQLKTGKTVKISGIANIKPVYSPAHEVYSPHDGKKVMTQAKTKVKMTPAANIRKEVQ